MITMMLAAALAAAPVSYDAESHSVTFTATAVGMPTSAPIEFLFAGAGSDHDYESLFLTDANPAEIAKAFEKAGIAVGNPVDVAAARFWPVGCQLEMDPSFESLLRETHGEPLVPALFMTMVSVSYIFIAPEGFRFAALGMSWLAYLIAAVVTLALLVLFFFWARRQQQQN